MHITAKIKIVFHHNFELIVHGLLYPSKNLTKQNMYTYSNNYILNPADIVAVRMNGPNM